MKAKTTRVKEPHAVAYSPIRRQLLKRKFLELGGEGLEDGDPKLKEIHEKLVRMNELQGLKVPQHLEFLVKLVKQEKQKKGHKLLFDRFVALGEGGGPNLREHVVKVHKEFMKQLKADPQIVENNVYVPKTWKELMSIINGLKRLYGRDGRYYTEYPECFICGEESSRTNPCGNDHITCDDCSIHCTVCKKRNCIQCLPPTLCELCQEERIPTCCATCNHCERCAEIRCSDCYSAFCQECYEDRCAECNKTLCTKCSYDCNRRGICCRNCFDDEGSDAEEALYHHYCEWRNC